jgi:hypothetical protein
MKKLTGTSIAILIIVIVATITFSPFTVNSQKNTKTSEPAIPEKVMAIVKISCMACHADNGNAMAMGAVNFSQWNTYPAKKQSKKASAICREVTNGSMPPSTFLSKNPGAKLNANKIAIICNWATSMKPAE